VIAAPPAVAISSDRLTITGVTRGAEVALLSVAHEPGYYMTRVVSRRELLPDSDSDGRVEYQLPTGVALRSIWIIVDIQSGEMTIAAPPGFQPLEMKQKKARPGKAVEAIANTVDVGRALVDILVVRPGMGAWAMAAREGSSADRDGVRNGRLRLDTAKLLPLKKSSRIPPNALEPGDVVAILDPERMEYWITKLERGK
jgi:hypothetical protein